MEGPVRCMASLLMYRVAVHACVHKNYDVWLPLVASFVDCVFIRPRASCALAGYLMSCADTC